MKFQVIAGDFPLDTAYVAMLGTPTLSYFNPDKSTWMRQSLALPGKVEKVELISEERKSAALASPAWRVTGLLVDKLIAAATALTAGAAAIFRAGRKSEICFACYLKDGRKFMAEGDSAMLERFIALSH